MPQNSWRANSTVLPLPPQRAWKIPPKTVVYTTSMSNGVNSDHSSPIDDPLYRPQISRRVMFQRSTRCCTRLRTICRGLMGWLFEVTSALSEDNGGLYQLHCSDIVSVRASRLERAFKVRQYALLRDYLRGAI